MIQTMRTSGAESDRIETIAENSLYAAGVNAKMVAYSFSVFERFLQGESILEMGPAEGLMTERLSKLGKSLTLVEGAELFCTDLKRRFPQCEVVHSLFEEYEPNRQFDSIILGHVLEHVIDPVSILHRAGGWLTPQGRLLAAVPNSRSLHRQAAVIMGLLPFEESLNEMDCHHGHRRVFNPETFRSAFLQARLEIEVFGGYWIKPLSNRQLEESWTIDMIDSFMRLGERYPDIAAEIYIVARRP